MNASRPKADLLAQLTNPGIIAVVRTQKPEQVSAIFEALLQGGVCALELTMTVPGALEALRAARARFGHRGLLGMGTVLDALTCRKAIEAGADFIVTPILRTEVARVAQSKERAVMLGAYTPTEAQLAHESGADFVKIFPADGLGPGYIRSLRAPLPHLKLVPTGGVDLTNAAEFIRAGSAALGVGRPLVTPDILAREDWPALTALAERYVAAVCAAHGLNARTA